MGLIKKYMNQTRKPEGFLGNMMVKGMNTGHAKLSDWGMSCLKEVNPKEILEVGCGGGRNADELLKMYPDSHLTAIDYSEVSVKKAQEYNRKMISSGRCTVNRGDVSSLDVGKEQFDLACAFETIYFWPGLEKCFSNVADSLKFGGVFLIVNESDGKDEAGKKYEKIINGMKCYTEEEIGRALEKAGFSKISTHHHSSKPWIAVIAVK